MKSTKKRCEGLAEKGNAYFGEASFLKKNIIFMVLILSFVCCGFFVSAEPEAVKIFEINGTSSADNLGYSVGSGDVNGDGYDDTIVGAYGANPPGIGGAGQAYVFFGDNTTTRKTILQRNNTNTTSKTNNENTASPAKNKNNNKPLV